MTAPIKTSYLYAMLGKLINVRLDEERLMKVRRLRADGIAISTIVREAIDQRFAERNRLGLERGAQAVIRETLEEFPPPPDTGRRTYDVHDAKASRQAIRKRLKRRS